MDKPRIAEKHPAVLELRAGKYAYCACGLSETQPFCDGRHAGSPFKPLVFQLVEGKTCALCQCKRTGNAPYCDGSHAGLD